MRRLATTWVAGIFAIGWLAVAGCSITEADAECKTDEQCRGVRICVDGTCRFAYSPDPNDDSPDTGAPPRDTSDPADTRDPAPPDTRDPAPPDTIGDTLGPDTYTPDPPPPDDTGITYDTGYSEIGVDTDTGPERPLSCHEFGTCQAIMCDRYDYNCKDKFSRRTSEAELQELDARQKCMRDHCARLTGQEQVDCAAKHCQAEWQKCTREGDGGKLDCSEFHGCIHLCNGRKNPQSCHQRCRDEASFTAKQEMQDYFRCFQRSCQGKQGTAAWKCARKHCEAELTQCWGC